MPNASSTKLVKSTAPVPEHSGREISDREAQLIADILREFSQFQVWRNTTGQHCEEIAELILPTSRNTFHYGNFNWPGMKKAQQQVDSTGALALHRFCAIADSLVTPRVLALARWIAGYYCCPVEVALKSVLPEAVRREEPGWRERLFVRVLAPSAVTAISGIEYRRG